MTNPTQHGAPRRPVLLVILDGFGVNPSKLNNAVAEADTPNLDRYFSRHPHAVIEASGPAVGLPDGQMGNSEVGHTTLGCGGVVRQDLVLIDDAIDDGSFYTNRALCDAAEAASLSERPLHLIGLVSDGGVHSHVRHLLALIRLCKKQGARPLLHMITDGRDTAPQSALNYLADVENALRSAGGAIASVSGRFYSMDRDKRWERTEAGFRAIALGDAPRAESARAAIEASYAAGCTDEFILPVLLPEFVQMQRGDQGIFFNFRKDRPRQLLTALVKREFDKFDRSGFEPVQVTCMMEYDHWFNTPFAFVQERPAVTLGQVISKAGIRQFHCAETEKSAHVTYFFNGGHAEPYSGEEREIIPSPKVSTYDLQPEMSAPQVADTTIKALESGRYGFIVVNFANGDMVGHTAVPQAVISAVETLDKEVGRLLDVAVANDYSVILTADHGNCDEYVDPATGAPHTQHTIYPVPCLVIDSIRWRLTTGGGLANIAPTVLHLMGITRPNGMEARSLLLHPAH